MNHFGVSKIMRGEEYGLFVLNICHKITVTISSVGNGLNAIEKFLVSVLIVDVISRAVIRLTAKS